MIAETFMQFKYLKILEMKTYFEIRLQDGQTPNILYCRLQTNARPIQLKYAYAEEMN